MSSFSSPSFTVHHAQHHTLSSLSLSPPAVSSLQSHHHPTRTTLLNQSHPTDHSLSLSQVSWVHSVRAKTRSNHFHDAISTYVEMILSGVPPDNFALPAVLKAVSALQDLTLGRQIHAHVIKYGFQPSSVAISNSLVNMYAKCGDLSDVSHVFDRIADPDQVS